MPTKELGRLLKIYWIPVSSSSPPFTTSFLSISLFLLQDNNQKVK
jgi:hypothetical protein